MPEPEMKYTSEATEIIDGFISGFTEYLYSLSLKKAKARNSTTVEIVDVMAAIKDLSKALNGLKLKISKYHNDS